jgi:hypothetical protein
MAELEQFAEEEWEKLYLEHSHVLKNIVKSFPRRLAAVINTLAPEA